LTAGVANVIAMNIGLFFFNLIPCPPLDGGAVLKRLLPRSLDWITEGLERYGQYILLLLLMSRALGAIMIPAYYLEGRWLRILGY
jgi:Zn-dependent protease